MSSKRALAYVLTTWQQVIRVKPQLSSAAQALFVGQRVKVHFVQVVTPLNEPLPSFETFVHSCDRPPYHRSATIRARAVAGTALMAHPRLKISASEACLLDLLLFSSGMQIQSQTTLRGSRVLVNVTLVRVVELLLVRCLCSLERSESRMLPLGLSGFAKAQATLRGWATPLAHEAPRCAPGPLDLNRIESKASSSPSSRSAKDKCHR